MRVLVIGAAGRMGQEVVKMVLQDDELELVGGVDVSGTPSDTTLREIPMYDDLRLAISETSPDVAVDFTAPQVVEGTMEICFAEKVPMVIGTTGFSEQSLKKWIDRGKLDGWKAIIAPNFAIGAVLMMQFAKEAAAFFNKVEIIEYHHDQKKDAPSGTAFKTAQMLQEVLKHEIPIHSVRLPGFVAHQEVIFGLPGQNLTIRHDSTHRESFMPGVRLALAKLPTIKGVVYGLEHILFESTHLGPSNI